MTKKQKTIGLRKIEIDGETAEPKIVGVEEEYNSAAVAEAEKTVKAQAEKEKQTSIGKQIVMSNFLGISDKDKNIDRRQKFFKRLVSLIFLAFVIGVLAYTFYRDFFHAEEGKEAVSWDGLIGRFGNTWYYFFLAVISLCLSYLFKGVKLAVICKSQTGKWHFKTCFETGIIGHYYNYVTPLAVGGQPFEIYHLSKHGVHGGVAASMPIIAFFLSQFAFVSLGVVSLVFFNGNILNIEQEFVINFPPIFNVLAIIGLVGCIAMPALVLIFSMLPRIGAKLVKWCTALGGKMKIIKDPKKTEYKTLKTIVHNSVCIKRFAKNPLALISTLLLGVGETFAQCSIAYFTLKLFGYNNENAGWFMEWMQIIQLSIILYASVSFIPTPGNSGAADLSFYLLFAVGVKFAGLAFSAMVLWRILSFYSYIIIGFIFTTANRRKDHLSEFLGISDLEK